MARRTIIVAAGPDDRARDAVALAASLARLRDARLLLVGVHASLAAGDGLFESALHAERAVELEALREAVPAGVDAEVRAVSATSTVRGLHAAVEDEGADILVLGHSHLGGVARALRGDVALGAVHVAPCAVAVAPAGYAASSGGRAPERIGAAFDGSPESEAALEVAAALARRAGAALHVVSVLDVPYVFADPPVLDVAGHAHHLRSLAGEVGEALAHAARAVADGLAVETAMPEGAAAEELVRAGDGLDLLVMGSRAYGPLRRVLVGSVVAGVLRDARCPVLVLPRGLRLDGNGG